ncbi:hypothetical protein Dimus_007490 [Dionaea muscipula]
MNGAPWLQQNPVQALSTPFANAVPFQQQFDPSQGQGTPLGWTSCSPQAGVLGRSVYIEPSTRWDHRFAGEPSPVAGFRSWFQWTTCWTNKLNQAYCHANN